MSLKSIVRLLLALTINQIVYSQQKNFSFTLKGKVNLDTGRISLNPVNDAKFYPIETLFKEVKIQNGKFSFNGNTPCPIAVTLRILKGAERIYQSDVFLIDKGNQSIICNIDSLREVPAINNKQMAEFKNEYVPAYYQAKASNNNEPFLIVYSKEHPNSYVALWKLIKKFSLTGYLAEYDSAYAYFTPTVKESFTGKVLAEKLKKSRLLSIGNNFPYLQLEDRQSKKINLLDSIHNAKYVLLDFWFSHCSPCISEFPDFKRLYATYHLKGFEIIGISIDDEPMISDWKRVIEENKLTWIQYLDKNGLYSKPLEINSFPTLFLLDGTGKIVATNLQVKELELFLKEHL